MYFNFCNSAKASKLYGKNESRLSVLQIIALECTSVTQYQVFVYYSEQALLVTMDIYASSSAANMIQLQAQECGFQAFLLWTLFVYQV